MLNPADGPQPGAENKPFQLHLSDGFAAWLARMDGTLALTTYEAGKILLLGPGLGQGVTLSERNFDRAMAMAVDGDSLYLTTAWQVWRFVNALEPGRLFDGWDRLYLPRACHVTGAVDAHDVHIDAAGGMTLAVTGYNCVAVADARGSFNPLWAPPFIGAIVGEDRCHLNGFCVENGEPAYATVIAETDAAGKWREHRADGGQVWDIRRNRAVARGIAMPHSPRLHRGALYLLEAGAGWFGRVDPAQGRFERLVWLPGFARGLRLVGDYALVGLSKPRNEVFTGLPLDDELKRRGVEPQCGVAVIELNENRVVETIRIEGWVKEVYDAAFIPGARRAMIVGLQGDDVARLVMVGPNSTGKKLL
ncbi:MAG: TIGR03032 family protein [Alphaproteobacteria bacterium]|nr:TIGR03032 family protein [Alphaproteobacteria bacterium]